MPILLLSFQKHIFLSVNHLTLEFLLPTMKISYLLDCYDVLLRQVKSNTTVSNKIILNELIKKETDSYRVYRVTISKREETETIKISKPKHSFHPDVPRLELKTIFNFNEFENYIPGLKKISNLLERLFFLQLTHKAKILFSSMKNAPLVK